MNGFVGCVVALLLLGALILVTRAPHITGRRWLQGFLGYRLFVTVSQLLILLAPLESIPGTGDATYGLIEGFWKVLDYAGPLAWGLLLVFVLKNRSAAAAADRPNA